MTMSNPEYTSTGGWICKDCGRLVSYAEVHTCYFQDGGCAIKRIPQLIRRTTTERYDREGLLVERTIVTEEGL
jgi:hypothetical protein